MCCSNYYIRLIIAIIFCKESGGGNLAVRASLIGMVIGAFSLLPFGILIGAFIGAKIESFKDL